MDELQTKLETSRSKVRVLLTYGAGIMGAAILTWGLVHNDREIIIQSGTAIIAIIFYWFGQRNAKTP